MTVTQEQKATKASPKKLKELESTISIAMNKIEGDSENDICRFLPGETGGYMHHFTMRKMKTKSPEELNELINQYILKSTNPQEVPHKPRAARGSRKRRDQITFSKNELDHMLRIARVAGDNDLIRKLTPKKDIRTLKLELISSVRREEVDHDLWASYVEVIAAAQNPIHTSEQAQAAIAAINASIAPTRTY